MRQGVRNYFSVAISIDYLKITETRIKYFCHFDRVNYINCKLFISSKVAFFFCLPGYIGGK